MFFKMLATGRAAPSGGQGVEIDRAARWGGRHPSRGPRRLPPRPKVASANPASPLKSNPPLPIVRLLREQQIWLDDVLLCTQTDVDISGGYANVWLIVTDQRIVVCNDSNSPQLLADLSFDQVSEFRCESGLGAGLLQARIDRIFVDLLRYSNSHSDRFCKIARKLEGRLKGHAITIDPQDQTDTRRCKGCGLMLDFAGETCPRCVNRGAVLARMCKLMLPYKKAAMALMALLIFGIGLDLVAPRLTQYLIDHVLPAGAAPYASRVHRLLAVVLVLACVQVARMIVNVINGRLSTRVSTGITFNMRSRLVQHLQQLSVGYYDRQEVGALVARVTYDTEALAGFVGQITGGFVFQIIMVVLAGAMMFSLDLKLALYTLVPAPLVIGGTLVFWRFIYPHYYKLWDASSKQSGMLSGILSGVRVVKSFGQEQHEARRFDQVSAYLAQSRRRLDMSMSTFNPIMSLVFQLGGWIVWYIGGRDVLGGRMTLGGLMAFFGYLGMFYSPLGALTQFTNWLTSFVTQAHRIFELLDAPVQIANAENPTIRAIQGGITFENVTFGYDRHHQVLRNINLDIKPGEMIGIVGRSGSGKSTIVNLICRFYDVNEGRVLIDGVSVRDYAKENLRSQIGVVLQEPFLFRGSIRDNIAYGNPSASPEQIIAASRGANCHDFILRNPHAYDTWVGERGAGLSGGERQRVSIARVLLTDPRILILDEATSSVDAESEAAIQAAMAESARGRTTIAIAHRLSTLRSANRILVVDNGTIVEQGSHQQLLEQGGLYARLVNIQGQFAAAPPSIDHLEAETRWSSDHRPYAPHWLTPDNARIHVCSRGALHISTEDAGTFGGAFAIRCFPVNYARRFLSIRYLDHNKREAEIGLIRDLDEWPTEARRAIDASLARRFFVHGILAIQSIEQFQNYLNFAVDTDLGPRKFIMRWQAEKAQDYGQGGKMLCDTEDNRYLIRDLQALPDRDRALFTRYIYW